MIIITKAMESKPKKQFQHGVRIDYSLQHFHRIVDDISKNQSSVF